MVGCTLIASGIALAGINHGETLAECVDAIKRWFHSHSFGNVQFRSKSFCNHADAPPQNLTSSVSSPQGVSFHSEDARERAARLKILLWFCLTTKQARDKKKKVLMVPRLKVLLWFCLTTRKVRLRNREDHISNLPDELTSNIISLLPWKDAFRTSVLSSSWKRIRKTTPPLPQCYDFHEEDFISRLPDQILAGILSSLSLKEGFRTSILSPRWRRICEMMPCIQIPCIKDMFGLRTCKIVNVSKYMKVVRGCLRSYPNRQLFSLEMTCCFIEDIGDDFMWWLYDVGNRMGIQVLDICFDCSERKFPFVDFKPLGIPSLRSLTLSKCCLVFTSRKGFNFIKILSLHEVLLDMKSVKCILSCCLILESWILNTCLLPSKLCINSSRGNLALKRLRIDNCGAFEMDLCATNLVMFEYNDFNCIKKFHATAFCFSNVPNLEIISLASTGKAFMHYAFEEVGSKLPGLTYLMVNTHQTELQYLPRKVSMSSNISKLELSLWVYKGFNLLSLIPIVNACPNLQKFHLGLKHDNETSLPHLKARKKRWLGCPSRLTEVEMSGFCGFSEHFEFAECILRNVTTLERLCISNCNKYYVGEGKWINGDVKQWSFDKYIRINQLQAKAVSPKARVIVHYMGNIVD